MDFSFTPEQEALRKEFTNFFEDVMKEAPPGWSGGLEDMYDTEVGWEFHRSTARKLAEKGWFPVIPHLNTAKIEDYAPWLPDEFYLDGTLELMRKCDAVCLLPGYEFSEGTAGEIAEARRLGIPVYTSEIKVPPPDLSVPVIPPETVAVPRKPYPLEDEPE